MRATGCGLLMMLALGWAPRLEAQYADTRLTCTQSNPRRGLMRVKFRETNPKNRGAKASIRMEAE